MSPILNEMYSAKNIEFPKIIENEVAALQEEVTNILEFTSDLYLKPGTRKERMSSPSTATFESKNLPAILPSKIVNDVSSIQRLF